MRISVQWLKELTSAKQDAQAIAACLTMAGLEVDRIEMPTLDMSQVVVARIDTISAHPDADRLKVLSVDAGQSEPLTIVTAAPNVHEGMIVPLALVGAKLANKMLIKKSKLRGVLSEGMLCGASEIGLSQEKDLGIMPLPVDAPIGTSMQAYLGLDDVVLDIDLTPNRGDCLSMLGITREYAACINQLSKGIAVADYKAEQEDKAVVKVGALAPRYMLQAMRQVDATVSAPMHVIERLRRAGIASINVVVDFANYIMIELGQPMHIFDRNKIQGNICVREAKAGESFVGLDEKNHDVAVGTCVIADDSGVIAVAGVLGNLQTAVTAQTTDILIESAYFDPASVMSAARAMGVVSQSAYRFERGVDYQGQRRALSRFIELVQPVCGGAIAELFCFVDENKLPIVAPIVLRYYRIEKVLGLTISEKEVESILTNLGFALQKEKDGWKIEVPSYRFDIKQEIDLIEEIGRIYGYDNIPCHTPMSIMPLREISAAEQGKCIIDNFLVQHGCLECINYSFISHEQHKLIDDKDPDESLVLVNPLSSLQTIMRGSLWPGLLQSALDNMRFQSHDLKLFERGLCFKSQDGKLSQTKKLALLFMGDYHFVSWDSKARLVDFYDIKDLLEQLLQQLGMKAHYKLSSNAMLHPGISLDIYNNQEYIGCIGALHPGLAKSLGFKKAVYLIELDEQYLLPVSKYTMEALSAYPSVKRDLAFLLNQSIDYGTFERELKALAGDSLINCSLFDHFEGADIKVGYKSWAFRLEFRDFQRTLVDDEINAIIDNVVNSLAVTFDAQIRT